MIYTVNIKAKFGSDSQRRYFENSLRSVVDVLCSHVKGLHKNNEIESILNFVPDAEISGDNDN